MAVSDIHDRYDAIIAGARCAGAATAMLLARQGLRVLVVDPLPRGRDTLSTHALMRGGVLQLQRWGLLEAVRAAGTPAVRTTTFHYGDESIPIAIKEKDDDGIDALYAPRRTVLDPILVEAAETAGAQVVHGVAVVDVLRDSGGRVGGAVIDGAGLPRKPVSAAMVIGADGLRSRVARLVGADVEYSVPHAAASIYGHWPGLDVEGYHWNFSPGVGSGAIPTNDGHTCVFAGISPLELQKHRGEGLLSLYLRALQESAPELADAIAGAREPVKLRAFPGVPGFLRRSTGPGWALVGDAGFFRDPLTAHGITDAFRDAELLARAISDGSEQALADYCTVRAEVTRGLLDVTDRVASLEWDMEEVKALHLTLNREMNLGLELIRAYDAEEGDTPGSPSTAAA